MQTKIRKAGGEKYSDNSALVWEGDLPVQAKGTTIVVIGDDDEETLLKVSMVAMEIRGNDTWQVVFVQDMEPWRPLEG